MQTIIDIGTVFASGVGCNYKTLEKIGVDLLQFDMNKRLRYFTICVL